MHLNREIIVSSAISLLDEYGLADTTMRRVATRLDVAPGALYWHLANKQALIAAIADHIVAPLKGGSVVELALSLRSCLLAHRDGAEVTSAGLSQPGNPSWDLLVSRFATALGSTNVDSHSAKVGARAIAHLVLGAATMEQSRQQLSSVSPPAGQGIRTGSGATTGPECTEDGAQELTLGVEIIVAGLKSSSSQSPRP